jgi:hypothetical protein
VLEHADGPNPETCGNQAAGLPRIIADPPANPRETRQEGHMPNQDDRFREAISDLANALQAAGPLAAHLRRDLGATAQDAVTLEAAIDRAIRAAKKLQPGEDR